MDPCTYADQPYELPAALQYTSESVAPTTGHYRQMQLVEVADDDLETLPPYEDPLIPRLFVVVDGARHYGIQSTSKVTDNYAVDLGGEACWTGLPVADDFVLFSDCDGCFYDWEPLFSEESSSSVISCCSRITTSSSIESSSSSTPPIDCEEAQTMGCLAQSTITVLGSMQVDSVNESVGKWLQDIWVSSHDEKHQAATKS